MGKQIKDIPAVGKDILVENVEEYTAAKKAKTFPAVGILFVCILGADIILFCSEEIFCSVGGVIYSIYKPIFTIWGLLHIFPGIFLFPVLLVIFCVQAIRLRKNRRYIKNCFLSVFVCVLLMLSGSIMKNWLAPWVADGMIEMKLAFYQPVVMEVHASGESNDCLAGGADGHEDIAFFQYRAYYKWWDEENNASRTRDIYILYSEDDQCDIEELGLPEHNIYHTELNPIKENWYEMIVENYFYP